DDPGDDRRVRRARVGDVYAPGRLRALATLAVAHAAGRFRLTAAVERPYAPRGMPAETRPNVVPAGRAHEDDAALAATPALALLLLVVLVGTCELLARSETLRPHLLTPSIGSASRDADLVVDGLVDGERRGGPFDCLVVG